MEGNDTRSHLWTARGPGLLVALGRRQPSSFEGPGGPWREAPARSAHARPRERGQRSRGRASAGGSLGNDQSPGSSERPRPRLPASFAPQASADRRPPAAFAPQASARPNGGGLEATERSEGATSVTTRLSNARTLDCPHPLRRRLPLTDDRPLCVRRRLPRVKTGAARRRPSGAREHRR